MTASLGSVGANDHSEGGGSSALVDPQRDESVKQVPEPLSPRYRSRVREVPPRYRSHSVKHEPESHSRGTRRSRGLPAAWRRRLIARVSRAPTLTSSFVVETMGLEPTTPCLQSRCSS